MSRLVARILLSIFMFPLAGIFYILMMVAGVTFVERATAFHHSTESALFAICGLLTWILVAAYWTMLWQSSVKWNSERITYTLLAAVAAFLVAGGVGLLAAAMMSGGGDASFGTFIGGVLAIVLWLIETVFIWRETTAERKQRIAGSSANAIACPTCGYNMTGLGEARCPECGSKFTLDELIALMPNTKVDIE